MFRHILVPLDGSSLAETVVPAVDWLANQIGTQVTLVHIIERNAPQEIHGERHLYSESEACDYLYSVKEKYFTPGEDGREILVNRHVHAEEVENIARGIVEHTVELAPDLIMMCAHGRGGMRDRMAGSVAQQVIGMGTIPVILFHPKEGIPVTSEFSRVLLPLDGDPEHEQGLDTAADFAKGVQAQLRLLHVIHSIDSLPGERAAASKLLPGAARAMEEALEESACEYLTEKAAVLKKMGLEVSIEIRHGDPAKEIITSAETWPADLAVLGTHGRAGLNAFWAGSVASKVVTGSATPLLLVPVRK